MTEQWSGRIGFILAAIGAAVGLGNIWRFSAVVGQNGGGAYLVPYLFAFFVLALPLLMLELAMGRAFRADVVSIFAAVRDRFRVIGWVVSGIVLVILSYYLVITGWTLGFFVSAVTGSTLSFASFTGTFQPLVYFLVSTIIAAAVLSFGVKQGIERMVSLLVPLIFLILAGMAVFATQLDGFERGLGFFLTPDFSVLTDPNIWAAALGQAFFSLSAGQGIMLTYGSYLDDDTDIVSSSLIVGVADVAVAMLSGLIIFSIVFTAGLQPTLGTELAFTTLPSAFGQMPFGTIIGIGFFGLLFAAAITSAVAMMEVATAAISHATERSRHTAVLLTTLIVLVLGLPSALSYTGMDLTVFGARFLDLLDESIGTLGLPITAFLIATVFTRFADTTPVERLRGGKHILRITKHGLPPVLLLLIGARLLHAEVPSWQLVTVSIPLPESMVTALTVVVLAVVAETFLDRHRARRTP